MSRKATIDMVAQKAGVSRGTVDRVINQRSYVKAEVKERVIQAMKELQYVPLRIEQARRLGLVTEQATPCKLGVVLPDWRGHFKSEVMRGVADAKALLSDYQIEVIIRESKTGLFDETIEHVDDLEQQGVKGIVVCAKDHSAIAQRINQLYEAGIPVVTFNSDISESRRLCFVGQNLIQSGRVAGELMMKYLQPGDEVLAVMGNPEFNAHRERLQGFCDRLEERGFDENKLHIRKTYNDYSRTYQEVKQILSDENKIKGIYMANRSTTACVEAVCEAGLQEKIHIICHDLTDTTKRLLRSGMIDMAIAQNIYNQGYRPLMILKEYVQKHIAPEADFNNSPIDIICAENIIE